MDFALFIMMLLCLVVAPFLGALATFYTGFGLNTLLVPLFMFYWDAPMAVFIASIVHLCNNILKVSLTARSINWNLFANFGLPAVFFALIGALLLTQLNRTAHFMEPIFGAILMLFALLEFFNWKLPLQGAWAMRIGGALSGFFGGFSGHQGALRALFLSKLKIEPLVFVATTAIISLLVDLTRVGVYFADIQFITYYYPSILLFLPVPAALAGTLVGRKYLHKIKHELFSKIVGVALFAMGLALLLGLI